MGIIKIIANAYEVKGGRSCSYKPNLVKMKGHLAHFDDHIAGKASCTEPSLIK